MYQSEQIDQLATALAKAQGEFIPAIKDASNPFFRSKYANLCSVNKACQEPLSKNGLSVSQSTIKDEDSKWILVTKLMHSSGQWLLSHTPIITAKIEKGVLIDKVDIQSFGSSVTYARRYALSAIVGVVTDEDDDGESAMNRDNIQGQSQQKQQKKPDVKRVYITEVQGHELSRLLTKCDQEFQDTVWAFLKDQGINDYQEIPEGLYGKVRARIEAKLKEGENADV